jgi:hypothetical protein
MYTVVAYLIALTDQFYQFELTTKKADFKRKSNFFVHSNSNFFSSILSGKLIHRCPGRRGLVVSSPPATEEIGAMGREIESHQGSSFT